jgi:hypothetical protein
MGQGMDQNEICMWKTHTQDSRVGQSKNTKRQIRAGRSFTSKTFTLGFGEKIGP